jgi:hypothetical protein
MSSGQTPGPPDPDRPGEPEAYPPEDGTTVSEASDEHPGDEPPAGAADAQAPSGSAAPEGSAAAWDVASSRLAAAAAGAAAAAASSGDAESTRFAAAADSAGAQEDAGYPGRLHSSEADAAAAAASAAAAAAVAAINVAIAASAAARAATEASRAVEAPAPLPPETPETTQGESPAPAPPEKLLDEPSAPLPPEKAAFSPTRWPGATPMPPAAPMPPPPPDASVQVPWRAAALPPESAAVPPPPAPPPAKTSTPVSAPPPDAAAVGSPDFDERGNPRREGRSAPFWLWFAGFWVVVALVAGATLMFTGVSLPRRGPAASGSAGAAPSGPVVPGSGASSTGSTVASPTSTVIPTRPVVTVAQNPPVLPAGTNATFRVQFIPASKCTLTRTYIPGATPGPSPTPKSPVTSVAFTVGSDGWSPSIAWGQNAQAGTYNITATCDGAAESSTTISFTWT